VCSRRKFMARWHGEYGRLDIVGSGGIILLLPKRISLTTDGGGLDGRCSKLPALEGLD
jgi:hypothetical protein